MQGSEIPEKTVEQVEVAEQIETTDEAIEAVDPTSLHTESTSRPEAKSNKNHLGSSVPRAARVPIGAITKQEMAEIRSIFGNMDDAEIQRLYKRVTN